MAKPNDDNWQMTVNPASGAIVRINKKTGKVEAVTGAIPVKSKFDDAYDTEKREEALGSACVHL
jgi:membrane carboxypeptidase/penicillin-binding protein